MCSTVESEVECAAVQQYSTTGNWYVRCMLNNGSQFMIEVRRIDKREGTELGRD